MNLRPLGYEPGYGRRGKKGHSVTWSRSRRRAAGSSGQHRTSQTQHRREQAVASLFIWALPNPLLGATNRAAPSRLEERRVGRGCLRALRHRRQSQLAAIVRRHIPQEISDGEPQRVGDRPQFPQTWHSSVVLDVVEVRHGETGGFRQTRQREVSVVPEASQTYPKGMGGHPRRLGLTGDRPRIRC